MHLSTELIATGGTTTGIRIPDEAVTQLGGGNRPKVVATVNGRTWRGSIARMGGAFWLAVSAENRTAAGLSAGDPVQLDVELDSALRTVEVPDDLRQALAADPAARAAFDALTYSQQRQQVLAVEGAKKPETRIRRIASTIDALKG